LSKTPAGNRRWLLLVHQLPAKPSNLRVQTWRRLQQLGAIPVKQAVYALPDTPEAREDFEWLKAEITGAGGEATVFAADNVDAWSDEALVREFKRTRETSYRELGREMERAIAALRSTAKSHRKPNAQRVVDTFRQRLATIAQMDFFSAPGRDRAATLLRDLEARITDVDVDAAAAKTSRKSARDYVGRTWATRPRPGVDRMASAWLITRFIDPKARFVFAASPDHVPRGALPFDMFGVEFTHHGDRCTFETLCTMFGIEDSSVGRIGTIVHDLDLKDDRYGAPEAATLGALIDGLQQSTADDATLLTQGMSLFESLYRSFSRRPAQKDRRHGRSAGPAKKRGSRASA
jgi:hypothetical protein